MRRPLLHKLAAAFGAAALLVAAPAAPVRAAGDAPALPDTRFSFEGLFGTFDRASAQRGLQVYMEVCANCHSLRQLSYRNLTGIGLSDAQVRAIAATVQVQDGPNDEGQMFERPGRPSDRFRRPFPNDQAARAANNGALPPDLSVIVKARAGGADYIYALLTGYEDAPKGFQVPEGGHYNKYFPGHVIAMPKPMSDGQVDYKGPDGKPQAPETVEQYARDVTAFLMWTAEPKMEARKALGFKSVIFLIVLAALTWFTKKRIWKKLPDPA